MKRLLFQILLLHICICIVAQELNDQPPPGRVSAVLFANFNYGLIQENPTTAFEVNRAYFGYHRVLDNHFSAEVKLDVGSLEGPTEESPTRRYNYIKNAYLSYQSNNLKAWFGLFDMLQYKIQDKFWGYRYLYKSYMDEYNFGPSADLGMGLQYEASEFITTDLTISNSEGYKYLQMDNIYKVGVGITIHPVNRLTIRTYYAIHTSERPQMSFAGFLGYRFDRLRFGGEYIFQKNYRFVENHNRYGFSLYSTYTFSDRWELFARWDQLFSNTLPDDEIPWNRTHDGGAIVSGVQFAPIKQVQMSLNFQDWVEYAQNGSTEPFIYMSLNVAF